MISGHVRAFSSHYAYLEENLNLQPVAKGNGFQAKLVTEFMKWKSDFIVISP